MRYVFVHGLGQSASSWDKSVSLLSKPAPVLCPDLLTILEHKEATYVNLYQSFAAYCNDVSEPLDLCGLSLGAILALNYAVEHLEKVRSMVLIGAQYRMPKALLAFQNCVFRLMPEKSFLTMGFRKNDFIRLTRSMMDLDFSKRLKDISCPTLILHGEKDHANKKAAKRLAENMPNAEYRVIGNTGHEVNVEAPERLAAILDAFW